MACNIFLTLPGGSKMPALGYGTWQSTDDSLEKALEVALEVGYRHIDTAQVYRNEEVVGKVLKRWFDSDKVEACLKESLEKLQLNYVDLYLIHFPVTIVLAGSDSYGDPNVHYLDIWKEMEKQYDAGRAKAIGISNFNIKQVERLLKNCRIKPANNQVEMHIYLQQAELVDFCKKNGISIVAYAPLGSRGYNEFLGQLGLPKRTLRDTLKEPAVVDIAVKHSKTPAQVLLRFLLQLGVAPIPKTVTPNRIEENFNVFDFSLDNEDMKALRSLEVGPAARVCDYKAFSKVPEHPEYGF